MRFLVSCLVVLVLFGCKKPENRTCWKSTGKDAVREVPVDAFDKLILNEHMAFILIQDSLDKIVVKGGENLINLIEANVAGEKTLELKNKNRCFFIRNEKKVVVVEIHFTELSNIFYQGTEYMHSLGTINSDYFTLTIRDGAGPVDISMNSKAIYSDVIHGWGDYTLHGTTQFAHIAARSNGYCNAFDLQVTDSVYAISDTPGTVKVHADGIPLRGYSKNSGNIWYTGTPSGIDVVLTGKGQVIDKN